MITKQSSSTNMFSNAVLLDDDEYGMVCYNPINGAVQVVESKNEIIMVEDQSNTRKVIRTINKYKNGPSLDDFLLHKDNKDLTILVFSVTGKTRGGKSFLLNMMIKYLESQGEEDWLSGSVPSCFAWDEGLDSITRGIWLWPKIYKLKNCHNNEVGILLMDSEGMFDGEMTDGEIIAISGISTAISYLQMFNIKEKITNDHMESVMRNLVKGIEEMDPEQSRELKQDYKLMFVVRDWIGAARYGYGMDGGRSYIEAENQRGTQEYRALWTLVAETFNDIQCTLLPFPGFSAMTPQFTSTGDLSMLSPLFLEELKKFIENLFSPINLIPPVTKLTGHAIHSLLLSADGRIADDSLSFVNIFTDHANYVVLEKLTSSFEAKLLEIRQSDLNEAKSVMEDILATASNSLKGRSALEYLAKLRKVVEEKMNKRVTGSVLKEYEVTFQDNDNIVEHQSTVWPGTQRKLQEFFCGCEATQKEACEKAAQKAADIYYKQLHKKLAADFKTACAERDLDELAGFDEITLKDKFTECTDFGNFADNHAPMYPIWHKQRDLLRDDLTKIFLQRTKQITGVSMKWLKSARSKQYEYFEAFTLLKKHDGNWDTIHEEDEIFLHKKVGFAIFGVPSRTLDTSGADSMTSKNDDNLSTGYSVAQGRTIAPIVKQIISLSNKDVVKLSCIFLTLRKGREDTIESVPLFRIQTAKSCINYVDTNCRVYCQWQDFLLSNSLPDTIYCYPLPGSYDKAHGFSVAYAKTPLSKRSEALKVTDRTSKWLLYSAGTAGAVALTATAVGVAVPFVGPFAIVGGGIAGAYGTVTDVLKLVDKVKHRVPVSIGDIWNLSTNMIAVASGMGSAAVAEGALAAARAAQCLTGLNALTALCKSNDTPDTTVLLHEIANNSLRILFYFNTSSSDDAIKVVQDNLNMPDGTLEILENLLDINSIQSAVERKGVYKIEKYVSAGLTTLVKSLLQTVSPEIKQVLLLYTNISSVYQAFKNETMPCRNMVRNISLNMSDLQKSLLQENEYLVKRVTKLICEKSNFDPEILNSFLSELINTKNAQLVLVLRYLVYSISSRMKKANQFYNNIEHKAIRLHGHDVECHPLKEVTMQIKDMIEQDQFKTDLVSEDSTELDSFIQQVLNFVYTVAKSYWKSQQFSQCLLKITKELVGIFDNNLDRHRYLVQKKVNPTCSDLESFFLEIGLNENYGSWLLQKVLDSYQVDHNWREGNDAKALTIVPAWSGILGRLYAYSSDRAVASKQDLVKQITKLELDNYMEFPAEGNHNLTGLEPCDDCLPTYFIYSTSDDELGIESGLIWFDK